MNSTYINNSLDDWDIQCSENNSHSLYYMNLYWLLILLVIFCMGVFYDVYKSGFSKEKCIKILTEDCFMSVVGLKLLGIIMTFLTFVAMIKWFGYIRCDGICIHENTFFGKKMQPEGLSMIWVIVAFVGIIIQINLYLKRKELKDKISQGEFTSSYSCVNCKNFLKLSFWVAINGNGLIFSYPPLVVGYDTDIRDETCFCSSCFMYRLIEGHIMADIVIIFGWITLCMENSDYRSLQNCGRKLFWIAVICSPAIPAIYIFMLLSEIQWKLYNSLQYMITYIILMESTLYWICDCFGCLIRIASKYDKQDVELQVMNNENVNILETQ
eukprot:71670_1